MRLALIFSLFFLFSFSSKAIDTNKLDSLFDFLESNEKAFGTISISLKGQEVYSKSIGYSNVAKEIHNQRESEYQIGSITKTFTAVLILKQIETGKISLSTNISKYFPSIPNSDQITIQHLLSHQSGLSDFTNHDSFWDNHSTYTTKETVLEIIRNSPILFQPGSKTAYCNSNYFLLGAILDKITQKEIGQLLTQYIINPLNLKHTGIKDGLISYEKYDNWKPVSSTHNSWLFGSGSMYSSAGDINIFINALLNERIIPGNLIDTMITLNLGIFKGEHLNREFLGHSGQIDGFESNMMHFINDSLSITYLSNGVSLSSEVILIEVVNICLNNTYHQPELVKYSNIEPNNNLSGDYSNKRYGINLTIQTHAKTISLKIKGQPTYIYFPTSDAVYFCERNHTSVEFKKAKLILTENGKKTVWKKE